MFKASHISKNISDAVFSFCVRERRNKEIEILTAKQADMQTERQTQEVGGGGGGGGGGGEREREREREREYWC